MKSLSLSREISGDLENKGQRIPENDMWIVAMAMQHDLVLVSGDAHFGWVSELKTLHLSW